MTVNESMPLEQASNRHFVVASEDLGKIFSALKEQGYLLIGPTVRDDVIVYDVIDGVEELPIGFRDTQEAGYYRAIRGGGRGFFSFSKPSNSFKTFLHPPILKLFKIYRQGFRIEPNIEEKGKIALIGVKPCDLQAIKILDKVLLAGRFRDPYYKIKREHIFIVAVNCTEPTSTCFCTSMNSGPKAEEGYDLALTEILNEDEHFFIVDVGSQAGKKLLEHIPHKNASEKDLKTAELLINRAKEKIGKRLETENLKEILYESFESKRWEEISKRCLACGNCTFVCPTCFCTTIIDKTDLKGSIAERWRLWDSCFTEEHSYIHGGAIRSKTYSRYRQWLIHKLAYWIDQFGVIGCVGCGRCITWCPVGIDIVEEAKLLRREVYQKGGIG